MFIRLHPEEEQIARALHYINLGDMYLKSKNYLEARKCFLQAVEARPLITEPRIIVKMLACLATTWEHTDEYLARTEYFTEYLKKYPADLVAYRLRAGSEWYSGELTKAIEDCDRVLAANPDDISALSCRGQAAFESGDLQRAAADLDHALEVLRVKPDLHPKWTATAKAFLLNARGAVFTASGDLDRAEKYFQDSEALAPDNAWLHFHRAALHEKRGNARAAVEAYQSSLQKTEPRLNQLKRRIAENKIREMS